MTTHRLGPGVRLSALYGACFVGIGVYMPFFPVWLESRGLDASVIGAVLALPILTRVAVTAPVMSLVDRGVGARRLLLISTIALILAYAALALAWHPYAIAALAVAMAAAQAPLAPLCDLVSTEAVRADPRLDYGRIRLWGSVTFLAATVSGGYIVAAATPAAVPVVLAGLALVTVAVVRFAVPAVPPRRADAKPPAAAAVRLPAALLLLIAAAGFIQASHAGVYAFGSLHWRERGFSEPAIGYLWAVGVVAEIILFAAAGRIVGRGSAGLGFLAVGAGTAALRFSLMALSPGLAATFLLQALHGLSFGATHLGAMAAVSHLAPPGSRGRAQGILTTAVSLGIAAGTVLSGLIFQTGGALVFAAMAPLAGVGLVLTVAAARVLAAQPHRAGEGG
jgi:MFS transporter, PPP family, 3-phenylpropionic acid transporter